jgi:hypothetical protein
MVSLLHFFVFGLEMKIYATEPHEFLQSWIYTKNIRRGLLCTAQWHSTRMEACYLRFAI